METNIEVFNEQRTKLKKVQFVHSSARLDLIVAIVAIAGFVAIAIAIAIAIIVGVVVVILILVTTTFD
jgi:hypothetical protein